MHEQPDIHMPIGPRVKIYTAKLTQTGTAAPIPTILQNTIGNITWTRDNAGLYIGTLSGAFPAGKVKIDIQNVYGGEYAYAADQNTPPDSIYINTYQFMNPVAGTYQWDPTDEILTNTPITITVYN